MHVTTVSKYMAKAIFAGLLANLSDQDFDVMLSYPRNRDTQKPATL